MKQLLIALLALALGLAAGRAGMDAYDRYFGRGADRIAEGDYTSIAPERPLLFTTSTCPFCKQALAYLDERGVAYDVEVVDKSPAARAKYDELGLKSVPVLFTESVRIVGFNVEAYEEFLGAE